MLQQIRIIFGTCLVTALFTSVAFVEAHYQSRSIKASYNMKASGLLDSFLIAKYQNLVTPESLAARLYFLASAAFEGRETSTRGQKLAAEYLASQYRQLGLSPHGTEKSNDAGYGIADNQLKYNDYSALSAKGISLKDKWVVILEDEPLANSSTSLLPTAAHKPSLWSNQLVQKRLALWKAGPPKGVLVVSDISPIKTISFEQNSRQAAAALEQVGALSLSQTSPFPPVFAISSKLANQILGPTGQKVAALKKEIDASLKPAVFEVANSVQITASIESFSPLTTENVRAFVEGTDPQQKNEIVVVSSHYDHRAKPSSKG